MDRAIPLGRLAGIRIAMSWAVPLMAAFYTWSLTEVTLPDAVPGLDGSSYWLAGIVGAALLFASLLAHEMGHALVGRREGLGVRGIVLTLWGGHTTFETEAQSPGAELRVSGIGPLTNLVLAGVFLALHQALADDLTTLGALREVVGWVAWANLVLAALNMLPGAPLDGGAVLGAIVWMVTRNRTRAQVVTASIGLVLGLAGVAWGVLLLIDRDDGGGILPLLIGGFIALSARDRLRSASALGTLREARIGSVMVPDPPLVPEWTTLADVAARARAWAPHTAFPVQATDGRITGVLTAELVMAVDPQDWAHVRAVDVAWPIDRVPMAGVDDPVLATVQRAEGGAVDRVLVLWPDGRVAGIAGRDATQRALRAAAGA